MGDCLLIKSDAGVAATGLGADRDVVGEGGFELGLQEGVVVDRDSVEGDIVDGVIGVVAFEF